MQPRRRLPSWALADVPPPPLSPNELYRAPKLGSAGVSTKLAERPQGRRLFDLLRSGDTLVVRWIDRLGRNYQDICETIREFMQRGVVIRTVINSITFDGATQDAMQCAVRDALIRFHGSNGASTIGSD